MIFRGSKYQKNSSTKFTTFPGSKTSKLSTKLIFMKNTETGSFFADFNYLANGKLEIWHNAKGEVFEKIDLFLFIHITAISLNKNFSPIFPFISGMHGKCQPNCERKLEYLN